MSRRLLTVGLTLGAVLAGFAWAGRSAAKPPDLPLPQNDVLAPSVPAHTDRTAPLDLCVRVAAPVTETPLFFRVRPATRRTMAACLLFAANPLLALAPTGEYADFDEDEAPKTLWAPFQLPAPEEVTEGTFIIHGVGVNKDVGFAGTMTPTESDQSIPSVCPWMRQQQCAPACVGSFSADVDLSHDVLDNLEMLRQAHDLLQDARELGHEGRVGEAMDCLRLASGLCPNMWIDAKVQQASAEVFAASFVGEVQAETSRESPHPVSFRPCLPPVDPRTPTALDGLYPETSQPAQLAVACKEEEPSAEILKGVAKPFLKTADLKEVACGKGDGALRPASYEGVPEPADSDAPDDASGD